MLHIPKLWQKRLNASYLAEPAKPSLLSSVNTTIASSSSSSSFIDYNHPGLPTSLTATQNQEYQSQQSAYQYDAEKIRGRGTAAEAGRKETGSESKGIGAVGDPSKKYIREVGDKIWEDKSLAQWPENDYRLFVGNLGKEVTSEMLGKPFKDYPSYNMSRVVYNKARRQTRGYGFVSFSDPHDMLRALREKQNKYLGHRPMYLKRSKWEDRNINNARAQKKKEKKDKRIF